MQSPGDLNIENILNKARDYGSKETFGKACSYYLFLFHHKPSCCNSLKDEFLFVFTKWFEKLLLTCSVDDLSSFLQTVLETCQCIKTDIVLIASELLFQSEYALEASKLLVSCKSVEDVNYTLEEHIEQLHNFLIDRWHFRMLNDKKRNLSYSLAIKKAFQQGYNKILDVGSGTGILSLLATTSGFQKVYSCETSNVMCDIQQKILAANSGNAVNLITKMSSDLKVGQDISERVSLIVTEIFDCGLLGEGVIPTIINAWEDLLVPDTGKVIPQSAVVYGVCIECEELRKHSFYEMRKNIFLYGSKDPGDVNEQPYTTEHMKRIKGGFKELSKPFVVKSFDFNDPKSLQDALNQTTKLDVPIVTEGTVDAIMVYFVLHLDDSIRLNSSPTSDSCWEQAVYAVHHMKTVSVGTQIQLEVTCSKEFLLVEVAEAVNTKYSSCNCVASGEDTTDFTGSVDHSQRNAPPGLKIHRIDRRLVARLNDAMYVDSYTQVISRTIERLKLRKAKLDVCFICCEVSLFPFIVSEMGCHNLYLLEPSQTLLEILLQEYKSLFEKVQVLSRPLVDDLSCSPIKFDLVISEPVDYNGLIKEHFIEDLTTIKSLCCVEDTVYIPEKVDIFAMCISSEQLLKENRVIDQNVTLGLKIDEFINKYKVSTHPDVDASSLQHQVLSDSFTCGCIDLKTSLQSTQDLDSFNFTQVNSKVTITTSGKLTGLVVWHGVHLFDDVSISTSPSDKTHWNQSCVIFPEQNIVSANECLAVMTTRNKSNLHFSYSR